MWARRVSGDLITPRPTASVSITIKAEAIACWIFIDFSYQTNVSLALWFAQNLFFTTQLHLIICWHLTVIFLKYSDLLFVQFISDEGFSARYFDISSKRGCRKYLVKERKSNRVWSFHHHQRNTWWFSAANTWPADEWMCQLIKLLPVCNGRTWAGRDTKILTNCVKWPTTRKAIKTCLGRDMGPISETQLTQKVSRNPSLGPFAVAGSWAWTDCHVRFLLSSKDKRPCGQLSPGLLTWSHRKDILSFILNEVMQIENRKDQELRRQGELT